ncbi:MAG: alkaline phosphatase family protein [Bacteroidetes bacterium]|nr:alkaline phosphatase family protein [Bacteroidota bacterium]
MSSIRCVTITWSGSMTNTANGFKRLLTGGFNYTNAVFDYVPTYTGCGHASIFTGSGPANHGIVSNDWYDRYSRKALYCVSDSTVKPLELQCFRQNVAEKFIHINHWR